MSASENSSPAATGSAKAQLTPERWQQVKELFADAQELNPEDREAFLQKACGADPCLRAEVESLLVAAESDIARGELSSASTEHIRGEDAMLGRRIGAYKLLQRIGRGGMATVYLAARADEQYEKQVAIKILLPELDSDELLRRFRNERQTLAKLDHPNIVKLLDGGTTEEGLPYLVMDYVDGTRIDAYCDSHKLSTEERLRLFCQVCAAVHCAHHNMVVHRDLKPSNILITQDGAPKLLDFGISKVLNPSDGTRITQTFTRRMTPAYASPEQVKGETVAAATDIYSLGVVLYELLTGHRPYKLKQDTPQEVERAICEQEPEKPSTAINRSETQDLQDGSTVSKTPEIVSALREGTPEKLQRRLRGDLDNIVLMALQKDPKRRYASVEELSEDIERHVQHRPVKARPNTLIYRTAKFVRRHKVEAAAATLMALVLSAAVEYASWQQRRADDRARAQLANQRSHGRRSVAVLGFKNLSGRADAAWVSTALSEMLTTELSTGGKLRTVPGESIVRTKIDLSLPEADALSAQTLRRLYDNLGSDFIVLGSYLDTGDADRSIRLDLRVQDAVLGETVAAWAVRGSESALSDLVTQSGIALRLKLGIPASSPTETSQLEKTLPTNSDALRLYAQGLARLRMFDALGARDELQKAVIADSNFALAHSALAEAWTRLGYDARAMEEAKRALDASAGLPREQALWIEALYRRIAKQWPKAAEIYGTLFNFFPDNSEYGLRFANAQIEAGHLDDGLVTLQSLRKLPSPTGSDPRIDLEESNYALAAADFKRQVAAATQAQQKGESLGARLIVAEALYLQAYGLRNLYETKRAQDTCKQARSLFVAAGDNNGEARALRLEGLLQEDLNDPQGARSAYEQMARIDHELGNRDGEIDALTHLGEVYTWQKDFSSAADMFRRSLQLARELGEPHRIAVVVSELGNAEKQEGDFVQAKGHLQDALNQGRRYNDRNLIAWPLMSLADIAVAEGDISVAKKMNEEVLAIFRGIGVKMNIGGGLLKLADVELQSGELPAAKKHYTEALQIFRDAGQPLPASAATCGLGDILFAGGDLTAARDKYAEALTTRQKLHGTPRYIFDNRLKLASLSLEEGNIAEAEASIHQALAEYSVKNQPDAQVEANAVLVRSLIAQKKFSAAEQLTAGVQEILAKSEDRRSRLIASISQAEVLISIGQTAGAVKLLREAAQDAGKYRFGGLHLEARMDMAEAQLTEESRPAVLIELASIEREARAAGFLLISRKAASVRKTGHGLRLSFSKFP